VWGIVIVMLAPDFIWWMLPVVVGMLIAVPFTTLTSRSGLGQALRRHGLLLTPEETSPPPELLAAERARERIHAPTPLLEQQPINAPDTVAINLMMVPPRAPMAMIASAPTYVHVWKLPRRRVSAAP
jgi:membrane glycosyltransferase